MGLAVDQMIRRHRQNQKDAAEQIKDFIDEDIIKRMYKEWQHAVEAAYDRAMKGL